MKVIQILFFIVSLTVVLSACGGVKNNSPIETSKTFIKSLVNGDVKLNTEVNHSSPLDFPPQRMIQIANSLDLGGKSLNDFSFKETDDPKVIQVSWKREGKMTGWDLYFDREKGGYYFTDKKEVDLTSHPKKLKNDSSDHAKDHPVSKDTTQTSPLTKTFIIKNLKKGISQQDVSAKFGNPDAKGQDDMFGYPTWEYDDAKKGYPSKKWIGMVDEKGLKDGDLKLSLNIIWKDKTLYTYSIRTENWEYRLLSNGEVKETSFGNDGTPATQQNATKSMSDKQTTQDPSKTDGTKDMSLSPTSPNQESDIKKDIAVLKSKTSISISAGVKSDAIIHPKPDVVVSDGHGGKLYAWNVILNGNGDGSDQQIYFFDNAHYLGKDTSKGHTGSSVKAGSTGTIIATYLHYLSNDSLVAPTGKPYVVSFHWDGKSLTPDNPETLDKAINNQFK